MRIIRGSLHGQSDVCAYAARRDNGKILREPESRDTHECTRVRVRQRRVSPRGPV